MTDIFISAPITTHRLTVGRSHLPRLGIAKTFKTLFVVLGEAYGLVYRSPFTPHPSQPPAFPNEQLDGRDPSW